MLHDVFGEITFSIGWKANKNIILFGKEYSINLKVHAYFEEDGITKDQEKAYTDFYKAENDKLQIVEK